MGIKVSANSPCAPLLVMDTGCYDDGRIVSWDGGTCNGRRAFDLYKPRQNVFPLS